MNLRIRLLRVLTFLPGMALLAVAHGYSPSAIGEEGKNRIELTNYRSGISVVIQGENGKDYAVERFYVDPKMDDRGVIYIRDATRIALQHNERNTAHSNTIAPFEVIGEDGRDGIPDSGDEGIIRWKIDRDQQVKFAWSAKTGKTHQPKHVLPAYEEAFCFAELEFEPGLPVVGTMGPRPETAPGTDFYYRGCADVFGDQWHVLTVADDDGQLQGDYYSHKWASDGRVYLFVVNPRTPCLSLIARDQQAQFYTTPAKTYFLPRIHEQISYVTDGVEIMLTNITDDGAISYSLDNGPTEIYSRPIRSDSLARGRHVLRYQFEGGAIKQRTIVKDPPYPSEGERHGYLMWATDDEQEAIQSRLQREPYATNYRACRTKWNGQAEADRRLGRGGRDWIQAALINALAACFEGPDAKAPGATRTYAAYCKQMLLDNKLVIDPVGFELSHNFSPMPSAEWNTFGYYAVNSVFDSAFAYDLLIRDYRADRVAGGVTPIEDLKIRDLLARWIAVQLFELRGFEGAAVDQGPNWRRQTPSPEPGLSMWDMARLTGAAVAAMAMPAYDTAYYGTSGFDGRPATYPNLPFRDQAFTWRELFIDADQPVGSTPRLRRRFNFLDGGLIQEDGHFYDRPGYYDYSMMGHCFTILANAAKLQCGKEYPYLERSFERAIEGTLRGKKVNTASDEAARRYVQALLVNDRFPGVAAKIRDFIQAQPEKLPDGKRNDNHIDFLLYRSRPYGLIWYQDD